MRNHWKKWYPCDCQTEGIMISSDYEDDGLNYIDLAFFREGFGGHCREMSLKSRLRWCWQILRKGTPWTDMVILTKETARELGRDLLSWGKYEKGYFSPQHVFKEINKIQKERENGKK